MDIDKSLKRKLWLTFPPGGAKVIAPHRTGVGWGDVNKSPLRGEGHLTPCLPVNVDPDLGVEV